MTLLAYTDDELLSELKRRLDLNNSPQLDSEIKKDCPKYRGKPLDEMTKDELVQALIEQANGLRKAYQALDEYHKFSLR